jgi:hypothetical protein
MSILHILTLKQSHIPSAYQALYQDYPLLSLAQKASIMAMNPDSRPHTSYNTSGMPQSLPPITALTSDLPPPEPSPSLLRRQQEDAIRDSGNFSLASQSKRELPNLANLPSQHDVQHLHEVTCSAVFRYSIHTRFLYGSQCLSMHKD